MAAVDAGPDPVSPGGEERAPDGRRLRYQHRRDELLQAATDHVLRHGLDGLSLRRVAQSAGVSHAALLHHFSTRAQLVAAIVREVLDRAFTETDVVADQHDGGPLRALWRRAVSPDGEPLVRAFVAVTGSAAYDADTVRAVQASVRERVGLLRDGLVAQGCPADAAEPLATLLLATMRGLAVDRLLTEDTARVDAAFEVLVRGVEAQQAGWGPGRPPA